MASPPRISQPYHVLHRSLKPRHPPYTLHSHRECCTPLYNFLFFECACWDTKPNKTFLCLLCMQRTKRPVLPYNCLNAAYAYLRPKNCKSIFGCTYVRRTRRIFRMGTYHPHPENMQFAGLRQSKPHVLKNASHYCECLYTRLVNERRASLNIANASLHFLLKKPLFGGTHFAWR